MDRDDVIRLAAYTVALAVFLIAYNVTLSVNAFLRTTDFRLYGSLCAVFTWLMLMMLDLTLTVGSFSNAWITIVVIALGLCVFGFGIHMIVCVSGWGLRSSLTAYNPSAVVRAKGLVYENVWLYGLAITPMLGGVAANLLIIWKLKDEELSWWMCGVYAAAYLLCVVLGWLFPSDIHMAMIFLYLASGIGAVVLGFFTVKEVFF